MRLRRGKVRIKSPRVIRSGRKKKKKDMAGGWVKVRVGLSVRKTEMARLSFVTVCPALAGR